MSAKVSDSRGDSGSLNKNVRRYDDYLHRLRRWILLGCDKVHRAAQRRSISRWFSNEENVRIYRKEFVIYSLVSLDGVITSFEKDHNSEAKEKCQNDIKTVFLDNKDHADRNAVPLLLAQMTSFRTLKPVAAELINELPLNTLDLLLFNKYAKKIKGNTSIIRRSIIRWFQTHTSEPLLLKDMLLRKSRFAWTHADVIKLWHVPDKNNAVIKILLGFKASLDSVTDESLRSLITDVLRIRDLNSKIQFVKMLEDEKFMKAYGKDLLKLIKPNLFNREAVESVVKVLDDNDFLQLLPKIAFKFNQFHLYGIENLWKSIIERLETTTPSRVIKGSCLENEKMSQTCTKVTQLLEKIFLSYPKFEDEVLFIGHWKRDDDFNDAEFESRKVRHGEKERPILCPVIVKPIEFLCILMHLYPNNELCYEKSYHEIKDYRYALDIKEKLVKIKGLPGKPKPSRSFKKVLIFSLDDIHTIDEHTKTFDNLVIVTKNKLKTDVKTLPSCQKTLIIHGFDYNLLNLVDKCFHVL